MKSLNFHQTFPPTLSYIGRLMDLASGEPILSKEQISSVTGIPTGKSTGKVEPHIDYGVYMGLLEDLPKDSSGNNLLRLTDLGEMIKNEDAGFAETVTQLICHVRLTSPSTGAELWSYIIRDIFPRYKGSISEIVLTDELKRQFSSMVRTSPFFSTYRESFSTFLLLEKQKEKITCLSQPLKKELTYVYAYALLYEWEQLLPERDEISANELKELRFGAAFAWDERTEFESMERLIELGVIKINRQLAPFTINRLKNTSDIVPLLYSLLI